ncbi:MAG: flagellar biosynthetic protein FliR [Candidatus Gastranaerophilales bacterium]|nr:flagellar biosynthetic protein FliR [Candidatus Gastranaerophilales bacterium]
MIESLVQDISKYFPEINNAFGSGFLIFVRILGLLRFAPGLNRKEIPSMVKVAFAVTFTIILTAVVKPTMPPADVTIIYHIVLNYVIGALIGYIAYCILAAVDAGGDMINTQMGMSSAMVLDPTSSTQVSIMGKLLGLMGLLIFINIGGLYWILNAFIRSFDIFPVYATAIPLEQIINTEYLVKITSNILYVGLQFASPILLATLGQDIILGIISKTAPQINVFQLSFLFKPVMGAFLLSVLLPMLFGVVNDYFLTYTHIF